jgi:hypothetical protein
MKWAVLLILDISTLEKRSYNHRIHIREFSIGNYSDRGSNDGKTDDSMGEQGVLQQLPDIVDICFAQTFHDDVHVASGKRTDGPDLTNSGISVNRHFNLDWTVNGDGCALSMIAGCHSCRLTPSILLIPSC